MSDLGVTECMAHAYSLAPYHICSPLSGLMNITFIITGVLITLGAILLHRFWGDSGRTGTATGMWILYGLGYSVSGIYPADINFWIYTVFFTARHVSADTGNAHHCKSCQEQNAETRSLDVHLHGLIRFKPDCAGHRDLHRD
ncbi:DUF998 domain-containing protein [Salinicoccus halodurans]|uniref:DUF998 domain-containing protein n=1 Tax=Salinicoccus halodurans TaxID=407035 RepID=UPI003B8A64E0